MVASGGKRAILSYSELFWAILNYDKLGFGEKLSRLIACPGHIPGTKNHPSRGGLGVNFPKVHPSRGKFGVNFEGLCGTPGPT